MYALVAVVIVVSVVGVIATLLLGESIGDVCWMMTGDERQVLYVSPAYETVFGRSADLYAKLDALGMMAGGVAHEPAASDATEKILLVDYDTYQRGALSHGLRAAGYPRPACST